MLDRSIHLFSLFGRRIQCQCFVTDSCDFQSWEHFQDKELCCFLVTQQATFSCLINFTHQYTHLLSYFTNSLPSCYVPWFLYVFHYIICRGIAREEYAKAANLAPVWPDGYSSLKNCKNAETYIILYTFKTLLKEKMN